MRVNRSQLHQLRERAESLLPPPPEPGKEVPAWFMRWACALTAELYAAAGITRDAARPHPEETQLCHLFFNFSNARYFFERNLSRQPSDEEWQRWLEIAEEVSGRPHTEEACQRLHEWLSAHAWKWRKERQEKPCAN